MKLSNFKDLTQKTDFGTSRGRTVLHFLKKPVGGQYLKVFGTLVPPEALVPLEISAQFERNSLCSAEYFSRSLTLKRFLCL